MFLITVIISKIFFLSASGENEHGGLRDYFFAAGAPIGQRKKVEQPNTGLLVIWSIQYTSRSQPVTLNVAEVSNEKDLPGVSRDMLYTRTPEFKGMARHMETKTKS